MYQILVHSVKHHKLYVEVSLIKQRPKWISKRFQLESKKNKFQHRKIKKRRIVYYCEFDNIRRVYSVIDCVIMQNAVSMYVLIDWFFCLFYFFPSAGRIRISFNSQKRCLLHTLWCNDLHSQRRARKHWKRESRSTRQRNHIHGGKDENSETNNWKKWQTYNHSVAKLKTLGQWLFSLLNSNCNKQYFCSWNDSLRQVLFPLNNVKQK